MWRLGESDVSGESSLSVGGGGWRGTGVQRWREVKPQEALQHKQWVTVCVAEALLDLRNCGAWPTKQKEADPVRANINTCVYACALASVCLKPQHCTGWHLFQPVRSAANLGSNQTSFFSVGSLRCLLSPARHLLLCLSQLRISQKAAVDVKRCDGWGVLWSNEDHFFSPWILCKWAKAYTEATEIRSHTVGFRCVYVPLHCRPPRMAFALHIFGPVPLEQRFSVLKIPFCFFLFEANKFSSLEHTTILILRYWESWDGNIMCPFSFLKEST